MSTRFNSAVSTTGLMRNDRAIAMIKSTSNQSLQNYDLHQQIGQGSFSNVYMATLKADPTQKYAVKFVSISKDLAYLIQREVDILKKLNHPNIIKLHDFGQENSSFFFVFEYFPMTLHDYLIVNGFRLDEVNARRMTYETLSALAHVHSNGIAHRDIKLENLLLTDIDVTVASIKLSDFGLSKDEEEGSMRTSCGTPYFIAPEILTAQGGYTTKCDIWSLGVVSYMMVVGTGPFNADSDVQLFEEILNGPSEHTWHRLKDNVPALEFIRGCLMVEEDKRWSSSDALQHYWFKDLVKN
eukprot:TRINITY_DN517_c0_g3_i1.p1 TRINITY_DN517_c0_g3~~TRINITY_DN517_c0_g3_i1.p1  ORF type:complete len:339 (+),score=27.67 TRINITY_DN517_c0_g3_i1:128-1018(+)